MRCEEIYETGLLYHHYANTAYPLTPHSFMEYKLTDDAEIRSFVTSQWQKADELSLYIHIPFCKSRCKFCEYTVLENTTEEIRSEYTDLLLKEMAMYSEILKGKKIVGFDLGGGTPAIMSDNDLRRITEAVRSMFDVADGVVFSVETTPIIAANEPEKIRFLYELGYRRISMGIQTVSEKLLAELGRDGSSSLYERAAENIRKAGFERFNIDLMYGFLHQTDTDFDNTIKYSVGLSPDYITLYRNRYKGTKIEYEAGGVSLYKAMYQYRIAYRRLTESGYAANPGKNTFSRIEGDYGTSDYLTKRVISGVPYVGMGLGAQSFGIDYLAYDLGAAEKRLERYKAAINEGKLPFQDIYRLPQEESMAKMISVAFYFGFVDTAEFFKRFGIKFEEKYPEEVKFVLENKLMEYSGSRLYLTERGADFINGVIPLFYSEKSKKELHTAFANKHLSDKSDEELFLSAYKIENYDRPSVTADVAAFTVMNEDGDNYRRDDSAKLSLLLIRRGEHPYMNSWALPGGFLRMNETVEECAIREITEETGVTPAAIMPSGVFSKPDRDPRGRIISNAFISVISESDVKAYGGDDAVDAKWFSVSFDSDGGICTLTLSHDEITLTAKLRGLGTKFGRRMFEITDKGGLAFDHAEIIASALADLRNGIGNFDYIFDFLPDKFTLAQLRKVQETVMGISLLPANFRRKASEYVEETDESTSGAGHRPAKLFRRKNR